MATRKQTDDEQPSEDEQPVEPGTAEQAAEQPTPSAGFVYANPGPPSDESSAERGG